jgi:hypothetical protein
LSQHPSKTLAWQDFLNRSAVAQETRVRYDLGLHQIKNFCTAQETSNRVKRQFQNGRNLCHSHQRQRFSPERRNPERIVKIKHQKNK